MMKVSSHAKSPAGRKSIRMADSTGHGGGNSLQSNTLPGGRASTVGLPGSARPNSAGVQEGNANYQDDGLMALQGKIYQLERDLERRQESYITRERAYKVRIDELEEELAAQRENKTGWMKSDARMSNLKSMHSQILNNVELVQDRTARILQEQERDLLRAFRARLFDVQAELEKEKTKKDDGAAAWIERSRQLEAEVEWAKEVADRLERVNQTLLQENNRLKGQFTSQEEDRNFLIKQLVAVKKDNARLRAEYGELEQENERLKQSVDNLQEKLNSQIIPPPSTKNSNVTNPANNNSMTTANNNTTNNLMLQQKLESEEKYKELNVRLRRLLAEERKSLSQVRQNYANELKIRTDMEMLLRQCVEDVRKEIARRYIEDGQFTNNNGNDLAKLYAKQPGLIPVDDFTQGDRERVLELLLSQERVVSLIYAKTFPINPSITNRGSSMDNAGASNPNNSNNNNNSNGLVNEFSNLFDGSDYPNSPSNVNSNDNNRPSTTGALQGSTNNNQTVSNVNNNSNNATSATTNNSNNAGTGGANKGITLPPLTQGRGMSR